MDIKIGDKIELRNCFSNEVGEYELVDIDVYRNHTFKKGRNIQVITEQALKYLGINNKEGRNMNFIEAVKLLELDENIKLMRSSNDVTIFSWHGTLMGKQGHTGFKLFIEDILAEDWYVVKNEKLCSFEEALKALKEGKTIKRRSSTGEFHYDNTLDKIDSALARVHEKYNGDKFVTMSFADDDILANDWIIEGDKI